MITAASAATRRIVMPHCRALRRGVIGDAIDGRSKEGKFLRRCEAELVAHVGSSPSFAQKRRRRRREAALRRRGEHGVRGAVIVPGLGLVRQARPALTRRAFHFRLDGAQDAVSGRRSRSRRRAVPTAPVSRPRRERARRQLSANEGRSRRCQSPWTGPRKSAPNLRPAPSPTPPIKPRRTPTAPSLRPLSVRLRPPVRNRFARSPPP